MFGPFYDVVVGSSRTSPTGTQDGSIEVETPERYRSIPESFRPFVWYVRSPPEIDNEPPRGIEVFDTTSYFQVRILLLVLLTGMTTSRSVLPLTRDNSCPNRLVRDCRPEKSMSEDEVKNPKVKEKSFYSPIECKISMFHYTRGQL